MVLKNLLTLAPGLMVMGGGLIPRGHENEKTKNKQNGQVWLIKKIFDHIISLNLLLGVGNTNRPYIDELTLTNFIRAVLQF